MKIFRWVIMVPLGILALMLGSFLGGFALSAFGNQSAVDNAGAFFGCFALVFVAGLIAPSKRTNITLVLAGLVIILALVSLILSFATNIEGFADRSTFLKITIPVSQLLGVLYAVFLLPLFITPSISIEQFGKEIIALGVTVIIFGGMVFLGGLLVRVFSGNWEAAVVGLGVIALGIGTWVLPFVHVYLRMRRLDVDFHN